MEERQQPESGESEDIDVLEADSSEGNLPQHASPPNVSKSKPFYQRCWFTVLATLAITAIYGLTTYPNGFEKPVRLAVQIGAFYPPAIQDGQWWRFITATLLHGNPAHWFNNVAGLLIFGNMLEPVIGPWSLMGLYIVSAVGGLWLSSIMLPDGVTYGASTIDFGLIGAYLTLVLLLRLQVDKGAFLKELRGSVMFVLLFVAWNMLESATVNLWGHLGGFIAGILFMLALWLVRKKPTRAFPF